VCLVIYSSIFLSLQTIYHEDTSKVFCVCAVREMGKWKYSSTHS